MSRTGNIQPKHSLPNAFDQPEWAKRCEPIHHGETVHRKTSVSNINNSATNSATNSPIQHKSPPNPIITPKLGLGGGSSMRLASHHPLTSWAQPKIPTLMYISLRDINQLYPRTPCIPAECLVSLKGSALDMAARDGKLYVTGGREEVGWAPSVLGSKVRD